uniref:Uncharacterized protein n=1 Tax=uncultured marine virus TaxID=186617 RepID=S4TE40_9VIRU|nr:hypothetical protein [uncultured marine virus]
MGWRAQRVEKSLRTTLYPPLNMARRRSKMFKQVSNVHLETVEEADWSSFLKLEKQDPSMKSAYIDKIRISWLLDTDEGDDPNNAILFVASHDDALDSSTPANNDGYVISATASRGGGGVVTLDIKRRITMDYVGSNAEVQKLLTGSSGAPIYLHARKSDTGSQSNYYLVIETWGRWFDATSL